MRKIVFTLFIALQLSANDTLVQALAYYYDENSSTNKKAIELLKKVSDTSADASFLLGVAFEKGSLVKKNLSEALKYYEMAASLGDVDSMVLSGWFYYKAKGVKKDIDKARLYFEQASKHGDSEASEMLEIIDESSLLF